MLSQLLNQPCTIVRRSASSATDEYGNEIPDETEISTVCELQQERHLSDAEPANQGELSDTKWLLVLTTGTVIRTGDVVIVNGERYEMFGDPWHARNPRTGAESHVEATVRRTASSEDQA